MSTPSTIVISSGEPSGPPYEQPTPQEHYRSNLPTGQRFKVSTSLARCSCRPHAQMACLGCLGLRRSGTGPDMGHQPAPGVPGFISRPFAGPRCPAVLAGTEDRASASR